MSLAGSLEEYLNDPNFEQNRIEYKTNKEIADRDARNGVRPSAKPVDKGRFQLKGSVYGYSMFRCSQLPKSPSRRRPTRLLVPHRRSLPSLKR